MGSAYKNHDKPYPDSFPNSFCWLFHAPVQVSSGRHRISVANRRDNYIKYVEDIVPISLNIIGIVPISLKVIDKLKSFWCDDACGLNVNKQWMLSPRQHLLKRKSSLSVRLEEGRCIGHSQMIEDLWRVSNLPCLLVEVSHLWLHKYW